MRISETDPTDPSDPTDPDWDGNMCRGGMRPAPMDPCPICRRNTAKYVEDEAGKLGAMCWVCGVTTWEPSSGGGR